VTTTTTESLPSPETSFPESVPSSPPQHIDNPNQNGFTLYVWEINVKVTKQTGGAGSSAKQPQPSVRKGVRGQTPLPGPKAPVVTYIGPSKKDLHKAELLVSNEVSAIFGETSCGNKEDVCQLIEVEPGFPVTLVYGANEVHYVVNVLKQDLVKLKQS
jgi:hypothetical protein